MLNQQRIPIPEVKPGKNIQSRASFVLRNQQEELRIPAYRAGIRSRLVNVAGQERGAQGGE